MMHADSMPMAKPHKGPVASKTARRGKAMRKNPTGCDPKGIHPMTGKTGNKKMSRVGKGVDTSKPRKGAKSSDKGLEGKWF